MRSGLLLILAILPGSLALGGIGWLISLFEQPYPCKNILQRQTGRKGGGDNETMISENQKWAEPDGD